MLRTMHTLTQQTQDNFEVGNFVWVVLTHDRFPIGEYNKLLERKTGPCEILKNINDKAYATSSKSFNDL
jgi:hypothetical protein